MGRFNGVVVDADVEEEFPELVAEAVELPDAVVDEFPWDDEEAAVADAVMVVVKTEVVCS